MKYYVKHNYLMDNDEFEGLPLEEVMSKADDKAAYTQQDIVIYDSNHNEVARRLWNGIAPSEEEEGMDIIQFGHYGYFGEWVLS